jgi:biotin carboxyl carrier protein
MRGHSRRVTLEPVPGEPGRYQVAVDDRRHTVDAVRTGEFALSLLVGPPDNASESPPEPSRPKRGVEVAITPAAGRGEVLIWMGGRLVQATVNGRRRAGAADAGRHGHGEQSVVAPMPGRVVRVMVAAGDQVAARQGVVIVEAMKMENELRAPKAGRVKDVGVTPGTSVEAGRVLVVIE